MLLLINFMHEIKHFLISLHINCHHMPREQEMERQVWIIKEQTIKVWLYMSVGKYLDEEIVWEGY